MATVAVGTYALAAVVTGFSNGAPVLAEWRVKVLRVEGESAWVMTCGLNDVGTKFVMDVAKLTPLNDEHCGVWTPVYAHPTALVGFA